MKTGAAFLPLLTGLIFCHPVTAADFNGDGTNDIGIFRPASGLWAVMQQTRWYYGTSTDTPVPADYEKEDYRDTIGIFRPSSGLWSWPDEGGRVYFGGSGDIPVTR